MIKSSQPNFPAPELEWILREMRSVLESGILTNGSRTAEFERAFADLVGVRHAIAVSNGTAALEITLRFYELNGAEVIVPTNTFLSSANAVIFAGGVPVLADMAPESLCLSLEEIESRLTERTKGVMVVHVAGLICPGISVIREFCRDRSLFLIEDAAHAHGAVCDGRGAGSLGDAGCFSFFPTKPMTTGEGGMITTNNEDLAAFARAFRNHGVKEGSSLQVVLGHNYRMDELSAVLGLSQTRSLEASLSRRRVIAKRYQEGLNELPKLRCVVGSNHVVHSFYKFPTLLPTKHDRDTVSTALRELHGIESGTVYWPPCHLQPVVQSRTDLYRASGSFPVAEDILPRILCLPIHAGLDRAAVDTVIEAVRKEVRALGAP